MKIKDNNLKIKNYGSIDFICRCRNHDCAGHQFEQQDQLGQQVNLVFSTTKELFKNDIQRPG